eukprot:Nitzschia sp. Nitz4//scaffold112_size70979//40328//42413//NITZ4_005904-RA/size70979-augustus-gene-0.85-mRNA-1//1//CDS//3329533271//9019//frame0
MSAAQGANFNAAGAGKKAVHVKWAGKTIALGTFPSAEADEKCARAKALTRAWRSTMRPKPSRDWVMLELERLGVRVVSGRLGRKAGEEEEGEKKPGGAPTPVARTTPPIPRNNSLGWATNADLDNLMQRRSSSIGLSMLSDKDLGPRRGSLSSLGPALGLDSNDPAMPPHRPFVGGGAAAAYEAARADHYAQKREEQQRRGSSLGLGMGGSNIGGGGMQMGLSVNPNQHYEMLKLHHMNLLNEIQETTLMMNLYQQQQLQQQQQQLQQQQQQQMQQQQEEQEAPIETTEEMEAGQEATTQSEVVQSEVENNTGNESQAPAHKDEPQPQPAEAAAESKSTPAPAPEEKNDSLQDQLNEQKALEERLKKLREDIARSEKEAEEIARKTKAATADLATNKRPAEESASTETPPAEPETKKIKVEEEKAADEKKTD